jgi:DNA-binding protein H-NS
MLDNFDDYSLAELKDLRSRVDRAISGYEDRKKREALSELEDTARKMGYSLAELTGLQAARKRKAVAPKYANPADLTETWTGRGRKPRWVVAALDNGKTMDELLIS